MTLSKRLIIALVVGLTFTIIADFLLEATGHSNGNLWGSELLGYWAAFGLVWYLIIVGFSKLLGRYWLERRENHYSEEDQVKND